MSGRGHEHRSRAELLAEATRLRREGLSTREIAERMGKSRTAVFEWFADPDGSKARARKASYRGACVDCGMPTYDQHTLRCHYCAEGKERPASARPRLCVPVRLTDIKLDARLEAAREAARIYREIEERQEILMAAVMPSDQTYWIAESARPILARVAA